MTRATEAAKIWTFYLDIELIELVSRPNQTAQATIAPVKANLNILP